MVVQISIHEALIEVFDIRIPRCLAQRPWKTNENQPGQQEYDESRLYRALGEIAPVEFARQRSLKRKSGRENMADEQPWGWLQKAEPVTELKTHLGTG